MDNNLKKIARIGYAAKGTVYGITGILTFLAALDLGGQKTDQLQLLEFLDKQTFGNVLLIILGIGLFCYSFWRFIQAISDPESIGSDNKAKVKRTAFFISGCLYFGLAVLAIFRVLSPGNNTPSGNSGSNSSFLGSELGLYILGAIGLIIIGTGIYQFIRIYKKEFIKKFQLKSIGDEKLRKTIKTSAYVGMSSRGILFLIIGYFALHAAITTNPSEIKTTMDAFSFLEESSYGKWLLGLVAAGLVGYAVHMFMMVKYRKFKG